jgi:hypothetical protein
MRRSTGRILFAGTAAALAIGFAAAPALATSATTLTVKVTGGGSYTATTTKTTLTDNGISVTCTGSTASGSIPTKSYTSASPVTVGTTTKLSFTKCTGPLGAVTIKINKLPYKVQVDSKTNSAGQTDGVIAGVNNSVNAGTNCSFTVTGSAPGYYTNGKNTLSLTPKLPTKPLNKAQLTISGVPTGGCLGAIHNGDHPTYTATYKVSRAIVIKSS